MQSYFIKFKKNYMTYLMLITLILIYISHFILPTFWLIGLVSIKSLSYNTWWKVLASPFVTVNFQTLIANALIIFFIGRQLEHLFGHWRLLGIHLASGIFGLVFHSAFNLSYTITATAATIGLFGAFLMLGDAFKENAYFSQMARQYWALMFITIGFQAIFDRQGIFSMLGGLIGGFLSAMALGAPQVGEINRLNRLISGVAYMIILIFFAYLGVNHA